MGHTMRAHPQNSNTANTFSTGILNKNESCTVIRIDLNLISFATSSFSILNILTHVFRFLSVFRVESDFDSGYRVQRR
jgi:hypothetical protein